MKTKKSISQSIGKRFFLWLTLVVLASGCSHYQYVSLSSTMDTSEMNEFLFENDTLAVIYQFDGYNCPVKIHIYNKMQEPLYIDWGKSAAIVNGERVVYWQDKMNVQGYTSGYQVTIDDYTSLSSSISRGVMSRSEKVSFIPPDAYIEVTPLRIRNTFFTTSESTYLGKVQKHTNDDIRRGKHYAFDQSNTPLYFRSFLTLSVTADFTAPFFLDNNFWVAELTSTSIKPFASTTVKRNRFHIKKVVISRKSITITSFLMLSLIGITLVASN